MINLDEIKASIKAEDYVTAIRLIEKELEANHDLSVERTEKRYSELLKLRVTANTLAGNDDSIIMDLVRKEKYPSESQHYVRIKDDMSFCIKLVFKGTFLTKSDAYVNTVSVINPFENVTDRSATFEFVQRLGKLNIQQQLSKSVKTKKGDFILLNHSQLSAPQSYHILFYENDEPDLDALENGIKKVLRDVCKKELSSVSFFPLGYAYVTMVTHFERQDMAENIANKVAQSIVGFIYDTSEKSIPEISFNFVTLKTMETFNRAFAKWTAFNKSEFSMFSQLSKRKSAFIESALTKDGKYLSELNKIYKNINENSILLLLGETGVGKSHMAKCIHENSFLSSKKDSFKESNCAYYRPENVYSSLFGWKKGSFTDASEDGVGLIGEADGGTLFLDEIGYADLIVQRMLLKFIDTGEYHRFGEPGETRKANVRLIFGTNIDIEDNIKNGKFAHDLYERISQNIITIPPLRERIDDIDLALRYFIAEHNKTRFTDIQITDELLNKLKTYQWPGNIRQLKHEIEKLVIEAIHLKTNQIDIKWIEKDPPRNQLYTINPVMQLEKVLNKIMENWSIENGKILDIIKPILAKVYLEDFKGKKSDAAQIVGIDHSRGNSSTLEKEYMKYCNVKKLLS